MIQGCGKCTIAYCPTSLPELTMLLQVLQTRGSPKGHRLVQQVLVEWSGLPPELATWEDRVALQQQFPFAPAWGQAGFQGPENVTEPGVPDDELQSATNQNHRVRCPSTRVSGPKWTK